MIHRLLASGFLILSLFSCTQDIANEDIIRSKGLYKSASTGKPLHGSYKSVTPIGGTYAGDHVSEREFKSGVPVGKWRYIFNGDAISHGEYLENETLKKKIEKLTSAQRVDFNLWTEGDNKWMLYINLMAPEKEDSNSLHQIADSIKELNTGKKQITSFEIFAYSDTTTRSIYRVHQREDVVAH